MPTAASSNHLFDLELVLKVKGNAFYVGENQYRDYFAGEKKWSLHAEVNAVLCYLKKHNIYRLTDRKRDKNDKKSITIYVARLMLQDENVPLNQPCWLGLAKPCQDCENVLYNHGVTRIKYTDCVDGVNVLCELRLK